ncbi:hypothetical protein HXZ66_10545 [Bacillus sp. A116_S68]|nr:hypothetical protein HXZ66_10545 [Bacillus sp. A116_S68]
MESPSTKQELTSLDSNHRSFSFIAILSAGMLVFTAFSLYQDWNITLFSFVLTIILSLVGLMDTVEKNKVGKRLSLLVLSTIPLLSSDYSACYITNSLHDGNRSIKNRDDYLCRIESRFFTDY